jgi:outer membrane receptor for ferrienterochelin and colicins
MGPVYTFNNAKYGTDSLKAQLTAESQVGLLQAMAYTNWLRDTDTPGLLNQPFYFKSRVTVAEFQDIFRLGSDHILRAAVEYRNSTENSTPTPGASVDNEDFAASGMWSWKITPTISLTNALRIDHLSMQREGLIPPGFPFTNADWDRSFTVPSFNSGLVWEPKETDSIRLLLSRGSQLPSLSNDGGFFLVSPFLKITGSPLLRPSAVTNYEIGWVHVLAKHHVRFRATAFHQNSEDILALGGGYIPTPKGPYLLPSNIGSSKASGLELELKGTFPHNYRWGVNYRPERVSDHFIAAALDGAAYVDYDDTTPFHLAKANLGWTNGKWTMDGYLQYHSGGNGLVPTATGVTTYTPVADFVSVDGQITYNLSERLTWSASGQNLTHASQAQTAGPAVERRVLGTMSFNF